MAISVAAHPSMTMQRELARQMKSAERIHEPNYTLAVSSVLVALSLTALLWLVVNLSVSLHASGAAHKSLPRDVINPAADIAENVALPRFPALSVMK